MSVSKVNFAEFLRKRKGVIWFSTLKYLEIIITSLATFFLAKKIGPKEMGLAMPVFLYITYSKYLALGVNQVVTKNLSRYDDYDEIKNFITINLQYIIFVGFLNILLAYIILDIKYALFASLVSTFSILRGFFTSYFRAVHRIRVLNKNNIIFSFYLLLSVLFLVDDLYSYLIYWSLGLGGTLILYFLDDKIFFANVFKNFASIQSKDAILFNLKEGVKLAITGFFTTILLTSDRLIINKMNISVEIKGSYQLADYVGTAFYMFVTTITFYFYPKWIENIRNNNQFRKSFISYIKKSMFLIPFVLILLFFASKLIAKIFFPEYQMLENFVVLSVYMKMAVVYLSLIAMYYVGLDYEIKYIKSLKYLVLSLAVIFGVVYFFVSIDFIWVPIILGSFIFIEVFRKLFFSLKPFQN